MLPLAQTYNRRVCYTHNPMNAVADVIAEAGLRGLTGSDYTEMERGHALAVYAVTNSFNTASKESGIPETTISSWVNKEEGYDLVARLRVALKERTAWRWMQIVEEAQKQMVQRLEYGDPHVLKGGNIVYHPVKAKDVTLMASVAQDKLTLITNGLEASRATGQQLAALAEKLLAAKAKPPKAKDEPASPVPDVDTSGLMG